VQEQPNPFDYGDALERAQELNARMHELARKVHEAAYGPIRPNLTLIHGGLSETAVEKPEASA
jgi:hypothetical protein